MNVSINTLEIRSVSFPPQMLYVEAVLLVTMVVYIATTLVKLYNQCNASVAAHHYHPAASLDDQLDETL